MKIKFNLLVLTLIILAVSLTFGCKTESYVAKVNDKVIPEKDYKKQLDMAKSFLEGVDTSTEEGKSIWESVQTELLNQMIDAELIRQAAARQNITVTKEEIETRLNGFKEEVGSAEEYKEILKAYNVTEEELRVFIFDQAITEKMYEITTASINPKAEQVHAKQILVSSKDAADKIVARLKAGAKFDDLAKELSEDASTKNRGGDLGFFPKGIMEPEVEQAAFSMEVGAVSEPINSNWGYYIVQVVAKDPERELAAPYLGKSKDEVFRVWLEILRKEAKIEKAERKS